MNYHEFTISAKYSASKMADYFLTDEKAFIFQKLTNKQEKTLQEQEELISLAEEFQENYIADIKHIISKYNMYYKFNNKSLVFYIIFKGIKERFDMIIEDIIEQYNYLNIEVITNDKK